MPHVTHTSINAFQEQRWEIYMNMYIYIILSLSLYIYTYDNISLYYIYICGHPEEGLLGKFIVLYVVYTLWLLFIRVFFRHGCQPQRLAFARQAAAQRTHWLAFASGPRAYLPFRGQVMGPGMVVTEQKKEIIKIKKYENHEKHENISFIRRLLKTNEKNKEL